MSLVESYLLEQIMQFIYICQSTILYHFSSLTFILIMFLFVAGTVDS